jgi:ribosome-binding protein aMBF1 (putative translation factor)
LGITQRKIRIKRSDIPSKRKPRKAFPITLNSLGDRIQAVRFEKGLLLCELAQNLEIPITLVKDWEGNLETPTKDQWRSLVAVLGLPSVL